MSKNNPGSMFDKLMPLRGRLKPRRQDDIREPSPSPMRWIADGVDHLNIWDQGEEELGRILAPNTTIPFVHAEFGRFSNMEAFWYYIQSEERDDRIRTMSGQTLKKFSRLLTVTRVTNFKAIIVDANWQRIKNFKVVMQAMKDSSLPFDCYYINRESGVRVRPIYFKWFTQGMEEIRSALQQEREPNFDFLLDRQNTGIYEFVLPRPKDDAVKVPKQAVNKSSLLSKIEQEIKSAPVQVPEAENPIIVLKDAPAPSARGVTTSVVILDEAAYYKEPQAVHSA